MDMEALIEALVKTRATQILWRIILDTAIFIVLLIITEVHLKIVRYKRQTHGKVLQVGHESFVRPAFIWLVLNAIQFVIFMFYSVQCRMVGDSGYPPWTYSYMVVRELFLWSVFRGRVRCTIPRESYLAEKKSIILEGTCR